MRQSKDSSDGSSKSGINGWFADNWRSLTVLLSIFLVALILRIFFAYGTSAGSGFALSGGSDAAYHLRVIEHIVATGSHIVTDPLLNYPFGGLNYSPPLFDWAVAIVAFPLTLFGYSAADASSIALVYSTAVVGAFTCIPVYFLGKEMFSRKAGYVAAAFFAISSLAIVKTVFSNGTESAFFVLFFVLTTLFLLKAVKAYKPTEDDVSSLLSPFKNKEVLKNLLFAGLSLLALQLSWIGFMAVIMVFCVIMVVQAVFDRFRGKSAVGYVSMYASVMLFATLISSLYYAVIMGMTMVSVGPLCLILLVTVIAFLIATYRIWVISIPVSIAIFAIFMAVAWFFIPSLYSAMTSGANPYAQGLFGSLLVSTQSVALSSQAVYAGMVTMWFSVALAAYMLFRLPKNIGSPKYLFIVMWFLALLYASWQSVDLALLAAPMYAIGAGVVLVAIIKRADLKTYAEGFKGATITSVWKKILKPMPLLTVLGTVFILLMPNVLYAVDASIPSNDKGDYNSELSGTLGGMGSGGISYLGATNFYIRDDDWTLSTAWDHFSGTNPGSLVTWLDYGMEAAAKGGFSVVSDSFGNGYSAASNILLGTPSGSITAMTVRLIQFEGKIPQDMRDAMGHDEAADLELIIFDGMYSLSDPGAADRVIVNTTDYVRTNPNIFGATNFNITAENAMYLAAAEFMTSNYTDGTIAEFYDVLRAETGRSIDYIGVTGNMLPLYYGDGNVFSTMAYLNSYHLDRNGSPTKYYTAGVPYFGYYYTYEDVMYDTMIWKALVGPSLYDYRLMINNANLSYADMISGLMFSDGTIKAYPGYGLGNFYVDEQEWWVTYSPRDGDGNPTGDWNLMLAKDAQAKQAAKYDAVTDPDAGGFINYFGGMAFLKYDGDGDVYKGTVKTDGIPTGETAEVSVSGLTVAVFDDEGNLLGKTVTNEDGEYSIMISANVGDPKEFKLYSGPIYSMEVLVGVIGDLDGDTKIPLSYVTGTLVPDLGENITIELNGWVSGGSYTVETYLTADGRAFEADVIPDIYSVTMTIDGVQVYTGTFTLYPGNINVGAIDIKSVSVEITILDNYGMPVMIGDGDIEIVSKDGSVLTTEADGNIAKTAAAPGAYTARLAGNEFNGAPYILVPNTSNTLTTANTASFTATLNSVSRLTLRMVEAAEIEIVNVTAGDVITLTNGAYAIRGTYTATVVATGATASIFVPVGDYGNASTYTATITSVSGETSASVYAKVDGTTNIVNKSTAIAGTVDVTINVEYDKEAIGAVVAFISEDMMIMTVSVSDSGKTTVKLPAGDYTLYAYARETVARDSKAYFGSVTLTGASQNVKIELEDAVFVSGRVQYTGPSTGTAATSTLGVSFVPVFIKDGNNIIMTSTDSLGNYSVVLPKRNYASTNDSVTNSGGAYTEMVFGSFMRPTSNVSISIATNTTGTSTANITAIVRTPGQDGTMIMKNPASDPPLPDETAYVSLAGDPGVDVKVEYKTTGTTTTVTMTVYNYNKNTVYLALTTPGKMPEFSPTTGRTLIDGGAGGIILTLSAATDAAPVWSRVYTLTYTGTPTLNISVVNPTMNVDVTYPEDTDITVSVGGTTTDPVKYTLASSATGPGTIQWSSDGTTYAALAASVTVQNGSTVYLRAVPGTETGDETFYSWTKDLAGNGPDISFIMDGNKTVGAVFFEDTTPGTTSFTLTTATTGSGKILWSADNKTYAEAPATMVIPAEETVWLLAMPDAGNEFTGWTGDPIEADGSLFMDGNMSVGAVFSAIPTFTLTSSVSGTGSGTIQWSSDGVTYVDLPASLSVPQNATVYLRAVPDAGNVFSDWDTTDLTSTAAYETLLMSGDMTIEAVFTVIATITVTGTVSDAGTELSGVTIQYQLNGDTSVTFNTPATTSTGVFSITAAADSLMITGITLAGYEVTAASISQIPEGPFTADTSGVDFELESDGTLLFTLTSSVSGSGTIQWSLDGVTYLDLPSSTGVPADETIYLRAVPNAGNVFDQWGGDLTSTAAYETLLMSGDMTVEATFSAIPIFTLTSSVSGSGTIQWSSDGVTYVDLPSPLSVLDGTTVYLRAVPNAGNVFYAWTGDLEGYDVYAEMEMDGDKTIAATFFVSSILNYNLTTRSYDLLVEPSDLTPGNIGYYYSGKMRIFAGQTAFDVTPFVVQVTVITFKVDAKDTVSFTGGQMFEGSSSTETEKVYYVLTENWDTCVLIIERPGVSPNADQIAYISLAEAGASPDVEDYMGEKAEISGYVGVIANGTMEITMSATIGGSAYAVTIEVPIVNGTYEAVLPTKMGGETITYDLVPSIELTSGGIEYTFELWPIAPSLTVASIKDGQKINMEMALTSVTLPTDQDVEIENVVMAYLDDGTVGPSTFDVTNNTTATIVLGGGTGWTSIDFGGGKSYILIGPLATQTVSFTATYDQTRTGDGNADLSVVAWDVEGNSLLTQSVGTEPAVDMSADPIEDWGSYTEGPNRVSMNEYGYGITLTNDGSKRISVSIGIPAADLAIYSEENWYASIVDAGNLIIDPSLPDIVSEFVINGNSSATFYLRLIWTGEGDPSLDGLPLRLSVNDEILKLDADPTNINTPKMSVTGSNIFDSMNGIPNIVWVLIALSILMALLVVWLGIRRGVFSRKR